MLMPSLSVTLMSSGPENAWLAPGPQPGQSMPFVKLPYGVFFGSGLDKLNIPMLSFCI